MFLSSGTLPGIEDDLDIRRDKKKLMMKKFGCLLRDRILIFKLGLRFVSEFRSSTLVEKNFEKQEAGHNYKFGHQTLRYGKVHIF